MRRDGPEIMRWEVDRMRRGNARMGEEIRRNRKRAGLTQEAAGLVFGVSPSTVGKWERGQALPSAKNHRALCKAGLLDPGADRRGRRRAESAASGVSRTSRGGLGRVGSGHVRPALGCWIVSG